MVTYRPPVNPHKCDRGAYHRRNDAAARSVPHADGRRDSHGRRRPYGWDKSEQAELASLRRLYGLDWLSDTDKCAIARVADITKRAGEAA